VVESLEQQTIVFTPDVNLGDWVQEQLPHKRLIIYPGHCHVHVNIRPETIRELQQKHPAALVMAHPECIKEVRDMADVVVSTGGMRKFAAQSSAGEFIVGTEQGLAYRLSQDNPGKRFYEIKAALCPNMKKTTLPKLAACLREMSGEITIPQDIAERARASVERMVALG